MDIQRIAGPSCLKTTPPTAAEWDRHRALITDLYIRQNMKQKEVQIIMREHGFHATEKMYMSHFLKWRIMKKISPTDAIAILEALARRRCSRKKVTGVRLRGRLVSEEQVRDSLKRTKRKISATGPTETAPRTPSDISIVDENEGEHDRSDLIDLDAELAGSFLMDAAVRRRPTSPQSVGKERSALFFIQKMRDWQKGGVLEIDEDVDYGYRCYLGDLQTSICLPKAQGQRRTLWMLRHLEPVVRQMFRNNGPWLTSVLIGSASVFRSSPMDHGRLVQQICSTIVHVAGQTVSDATGHPLMVLCRFLFTDERQLPFLELLRHCSSLAREGFGVGSWEHCHIDAARCRYLYRKGAFQEAESVIRRLIEDLSRDLSPDVDAAEACRCASAIVYIEMHNFDKAEATLLEVIEYCCRASQERGLAIAQLNPLLKTLYSRALGGMRRSKLKQKDFASSENLARQQLLYSESAFGSYHMDTVYTLFRLNEALRAQEKWAEVDALMREWKDVVNPPGLDVTDYEELV